MNAKAHITSRPALTAPLFTPLTGLVQRECACSGSQGLTGEVGADEPEEVQRSPANQSGQYLRPPVATEETDGQSRSGDRANRTSMNARLGHDFSKLSIDFKRNLTVQTKLTVSQPGDRFEREADRVAEQVMRLDQDADFEAGTSAVNLPTISRWVGQSDDSQVRRQSAEEDTQAAPEEEEEFSTASLLSLKEASGSRNTLSTGVVGQIQSMRGGGQPLAPTLRAFFEPRFGHDFSHVRVHTDSRAARTTQDLNARAYTLGRDIAFAPTEYRPDTTAGRKLLAHELTHVVQQSDQVQTVMRDCDCPAMGATKPPKDLDTFLRGNFPQLRTPDYCVTGAATKTYNCFAWSVGNTSKWLDKEVDSVHGDNNGKLEFSDFDKMYAKNLLKPVTGSTPSNAEVALYAKGTTPTHAARRTGVACGKFESKLGENVRIAHFPNQIEGGPVYGNINRYYVPWAKP